MTELGGGVCVLDLVDEFGFPAGHVVVEAVQLPAFFCLLVVVSLLHLILL